MREPSRAVWINCLSVHPTKGTIRHRTRIFWGLRMLNARTALFAVTTIVTSVCRPDQADAELLKARLAQNLGPISGIVIVAKDQGFFEKRGLDISVSNFTSGKQCLDTVVGGGADIATTAEAPFTAGTGSEVYTAALLNSAGLRRKTSP